MTGWRVYSRVAVMAGAAIALAGCSGIERPTLPPPAEPRSIELGWVERDASSRFTFRVERLSLGEEGWQAVIEVTNGSDSPYRLGGGSVGLALFDTTSRGEVLRLTDDLTRAPPTLRPDRETPEPPAVLGPGASWAARIAGTEVLRAGSVVRVSFGPYSRVGARDITGGADILWVTRHAVRL
jgi:hypothetical protein